MIGLVVTGHGHFADGIHTSAQMIAGGVYGKVVSIDDEEHPPRGGGPKVVITICIPLRSPEPAEMKKGGIPPYLLRHFTFLSERAQQAQGPHRMFGILRGTPSLVICCRAC